MIHKYSHKWGPIYKISYDYITIMSELRSTFLDMIRLQNRKIILDSVYRLVYDFTKRNL